MTQVNRRRSPRLGPDGAERISAGCYGALIAATTLIGVSEAPLGNLVLIVVLTNLIYFATHVFAYTIGGADSGGEGWQTVRHHARVSAPMVSVTFVPVTAVVIAELSGVSRDDALILGVSLALLYLVAVATGGAYLRRLRPLAVVIVAALTFVISVVLVVAKAGLH